MRRAASPPEPDAAVSHRVRPEESAAHCRDGAEPRRAEPAAAVRRGPPSELRARAAGAQREQPLAGQEGRPERPSELREHAAGVPVRPWVRQAARREEPPEARVAVRRAAAAERDVRAPVRPWEVPAAVPSAGPAAEHAVAVAARPSVARGVRLSAAPWALPSDRARLARRRMRSQRSAPRSPQLRKAATATAPRSRWWQEGAV